VISATWITQKKTKIGNYEKGKIAETVQGKKTNAEGNCKSKKTKRPVSRKAKDPCRGQGGTEGQHKKQRGPQRGSAWMTTIKRQRTHSRQRKENPASTTKENMMWQQSKEEVGQDLADKEGERGDSKRGENVCHTKRIRKTTQARYATKPEHMGKKRGQI